MNQLDIVIPAYKATHLPQLLESLALQSAQTFRVWVIDDASPEAIEAACEPFRERLDLRYHRFESNLGGRDLAGHWNRAVALTDAPWLVLPGDDDFFDPGCVAALLDCLRANGQSHQCWSFAVRTVDGAGHELSRTPAARASTAADYLQQRLRNQVTPVTIGYAFARAAFDRAEGFASFDRGWHSDDASWALFGAQQGIEPVPGASVAWRCHDGNISPQMRGDPRRTLAAHEAFLQWLRSRRTELDLSDEQLQELSEAVAGVMRWELAQAPLPLWLREAGSLSVRMSPYTGHSVLGELLRLIKWRL
jgi:hypothetical protein